ncbi:Serine/threonine-protein kinase Nek2 [Mortierella claussenii]|nr:Serine/threonine-protein kinase Nek2 [Mortierella claussenii]
MQHDPRQIEEYESLESIGSGSFGLIRKVKRKTDGKILARKEIDYRKMTLKEKEQLVSEVNILKDLKHPNIVEFLERAIDRENSFIYILMEYCEGGDLAAVIRRHRERLVHIPEEFVWTIMTQLTLALHECHCGMTRGDDHSPPMPRAPILHRDLKPDNIFLDANKNVKLGDFGLSRSLTNPQNAFAQTYVGTPYYMSPELISSSLYDVKSDIWSLGCVMFEMCALEPPFLADSQAQLSAKIKLGKIPMLPPQYSTELSLVVRSMLQVNPRKRPTTTDLLANPRIKLCKKQLEIEHRAEELDNRERSINEFIEKYRERESTLVLIERKLRADEQRLREMETVLNSREEALRSKESYLTEQGRKLDWERQQMEDKRREFLQEQERRQSMAQRGLSTKPSGDAMVIDHNGYSQQDNSVTATKALSISSATNTKSTSTGSSILDQYLMARGKDTLPLADHGPIVSYTAPRRKTGLSAGGRSSLQPFHALRTVGAPMVNGSSTQSSTSEALDLGGTHSGVSLHLTGNATSNQKGSIGLLTGGVGGGNGPSKPQGQSSSLPGTNGKESRLSGKLGQLGGSLPATDTQRLRGKSKSASALIASMSLASAPSSSSSTNSAAFNPFLVPESSKSSATLTTSSTISSSAPASDIHMSDTGELSSLQQQLSSQSSTATTNGGSGTGFLRPTAPLSNGSATRQPFSFSSSSSAIGSFSSRRGQASSNAPPIGHIRFNPAPAPSATVATATATAGSSSLLSAPTPATTMGGSPSLSTSITSHGSTSQMTTDTATAQGTATLPATPQTATGGTTLQNEERFSRARTPPLRTDRQSEEDLRMEWDDDIPSPFIKRTYTRPLPPPPPSISSGSWFRKNPMGT